MTTNNNYTGYTGKDIKIKIFNHSDCDTLEKIVNEWMLKNDKEIIDIKFSTNRGSYIYKYVLITYKA